MSNVTASQARLLTALASSTATDPILVQCSSLRSATRIYGTKATMTTAVSLCNRGLVHWDHSTNLFNGQRLTLTDAGRKVAENL
jgi:hypothetical protein